MSNASGELIGDLIASSCLLGWWELRWDEDAAVHFADERNGVSDAVVLKKTTRWVRNRKSLTNYSIYPSRLLPRVLTGLLSLLIRLIAPDVMDIVQSADLREETGVGLVVVFTEVDGAGPVVSPFNHGAGLQSIRSHLINVVAWSRIWDWPVAEVQQVLQVASSQESSTFAGEFHIVLKRHNKSEWIPRILSLSYRVLLQLFLGQIDLLKTASVAPDVHELIEVSDLNRPASNKIAWQIFLWLNQLHCLLTVNTRIVINSQSDVDTH